jgi:16S rRNA processing protein RimM
VSDLVEVGRVGRPHGVAGAFVVERPSDDPGRFAVGARLLAGDVEVEVVESRRVGGGRLAIRLDRPVARGTVLEVPRATLPEPEEDAYYVFQLVGLRVEEAGGRALGRVAEVLELPANDVLELDTGVLLPLVGACVREVDLQAGRIVVEHGYAEPQELDA